MNTAFQKVYTKITQITKATCSLKAQGVGNDELAIVNGRLAQVVKIWGEDINFHSGMIFIHRSLSLSSPSSFRIC